MASLADRIRAALDTDIVNTAALGGGCVGDVRRVTLADGRDIVAKIASRGGLGVEGFMLRYLARNSNLPVPEVHLADDDLLLMDYAENDGDLSNSAQEDAAHHLAALHGIAGPSFGFERDTVIGGLPQPNPPATSWIEFFRDHRLMSMAREAHRAQRLPLETLTKIETLCARLDRWITEPEKPVLIHGDCWTGNVLCHRGRLAALIDPAIYFADPEIELAFATLFGTFGEPFFKRYGELRPLAPGFFEERRDLYNLYPLLVHVRLFGGSYIGQAERIVVKYLNC